MNDEGTTVRIVCANQVVREPDPITQTQPPRVLGREHVGAVLEQKPLSTLGADDAPDSASRFVERDGRIGRQFR